MHNYKTIENKKPFIFNKKVDNSFRVIPFNKDNNTLAPIRYFPPACQEWSNSVYAYNNMTIKSINIAQKNLTCLIKSYFNLYFSKNLLHSERNFSRFKRYTANKIFVSKAELKHTSTKVIITLYVYNEERRRLIKKLKRMQAILFFSFNIAFFKRKYNPLFFISKKLDFFLKEKTFSLKNSLEEIKIYIIEEIKYEKKALLEIDNINLRKEKLLIIKDLEENLNKILNILLFSTNDPVLVNRYENIYKKVLSKIFLEKEIALISHYKLKLSLNKYKLEDVFLSKLSGLISKIYNKDVEFNIVNLKAVYLNSDILTQAISLKLRNRDNKLLRVLESFLSMVKLPSVNIWKERFAYLNLEDLWINRVKNFTINSLLLNEKSDSVNNILIGLFKGNIFTNLLTTNIYNKKVDNGRFNKLNLLNNVLQLLKYKNMAGVRLEAKGRLTRRFTASRSVFKIKWKGSLKNIDSTYRGLSSVILRGHVKSNVQYSIINSKTRNGSFGLKGWISGK